MSEDSINEVEREMHSCAYYSLYSATLEAVDYRRSAKAVLNYRLVSPTLALGVGFALPWVELIVGIGLFSVPAWRPVAAIAMGLGFLFLVSSASVLLRKIDVSCGCAGDGGDRVSVITCLRACAIVGAGAALIVGDANAMPSLVLGVVVGLHR